MVGVYNNIVSHILSGSISPWPAGVVATTYTFHSHTVLTGSCNYCHLLATGCELTTNELIMTTSQCTHNLHYDARVPIKTELGNEANPFKYPTLFH